MISNAVAQQGVKLLVNAPVEEAGLDARPARENGHRDIVFMKGTVRAFLSDASEIRIVSSREVQYHVSRVRRIEKIKYPRGSGRESFPKSDGRPSFKSQPFAGLRIR